MSHPTSGLCPVCVHLETRACNPTSEWWCTADANGNYVPLGAFPTSCVDFESSEPDVFEFEVEYTLVVEYTGRITQEAEDEEEAVAKVLQWLEDEPCPTEGTDVTNKEIKAVAIGGTGDEE